LDYNHAESIAANNQSACLSHALCVVSQCQHITMCELERGGTSELITISSCKNGKENSLMGVRYINNSMLIVVLTMKPLNTAANLFYILGTD